MTTWQQQPTDNVQVPQVVGLSPEAAFNVVGQASLAPQFSAQPVAGEVPGVPSQWGQVPSSFAGQPPLPGQAATHVVAQNPMAGAWVPHGSVVYMEWAEMQPVASEQEGGSNTGWIVAAILGAVLVVAGLAWLLTSGGDANPEPSETATKTATATATVTERPGPRPTQTVTATATQTATKTATATATVTATATTTKTATATVKPTPTDEP